MPYKRLLRLHPRGNTYAHVYHPAHIRVEFGTLWSQRRIMMQRLHKTGTHSPISGLQRLKMSRTSPVRVLICDDSALVRSLLDRMLRDDPGIKVVGRAANGLQAIEAVRAGAIDVVVLDIEMLVLDGLTALPRILAADLAIRVLISSTLTTKGAAIALKSLRLGASDFISKATSEGGNNAATFAQELIVKARGLGRQSHAQRAARAGRHRPAAMAEPTSTAFSLRASSSKRHTILTKGSSPSGPAALLSPFQVLGHRIAVPIVLTPHMLASFTAHLRDTSNGLGVPPAPRACMGNSYGQVMSTWHPATIT